MSYKQYCDLIDDNKHCQLCQKIDNKSYCQFSKCSHIFHVNCLVNHRIHNDSICPECIKPYYDPRIEVACAFKINSLPALQDVLYNALNN